MIYKIPSVSKDCPHCRCDAFDEKVFDYTNLKLAAYYMKLMITYSKITENKISNNS